MMVSIGLGLGGDAAGCGGNCCGHFAFGGGVQCNMVKQVEHHMAWFGGGQCAAVRGCALGISRGVG